MIHSFLFSVPFRSFFFSSCARQVVADGRFLHLWKWSVFCENAGTRERENVKTLECVDVRVIRLFFCLFSALFWRSCVKCCRMDEMWWGEEENFVYDWFAADVVVVLMFFVKNVSCKDMGLVVLLHTRMWWNGGDGSILRENVEACGWLSLICFLAFSLAFRFWLSG